MYHIPLGFDTQNFTQLPLQPSSANSGLKPHTLINELWLLAYDGLACADLEKATLSEMESTQGKKSVF